jgi:hypothetical protein
MSGRKPLIIGPFLSMEVLCGLQVFTFRMCYNLRPGGATTGKWRIPNGKDESGLFSCSEFRRW